MSHTVQWAPLLQALALELDCQLDLDSIRTLMRQLGSRIAQSMPLPQLDTLDELAQAMNQHWHTLGWGEVSLHDAGQALQLQHRHAPFTAVFGLAAQAWADAILEGVYAVWLHSAGAPEALVLRHLHDADSASDSATLHFALTARQD